MKLIVYKGQHCWLIEDVNKMLAKKDEKIAELEEKLEIARVSNKTKGKKGKTSEEEHADEILAKEKKEAKANLKRTDDSPIHGPSAGASA